MRHVGHPKPGGATEAMMFDEIDEKYYRRRACDARERADAAIDPRIAIIHRQFAEEYERKAEAARTPRVAERPTLSVRHAANR